MMIHLYRWLYMWVCEFSTGVTAQVLVLKCVCVCVCHLQSKKAYGTIKGWNLWIALKILPVVNCTISVHFVKGQIALTTSALSALQTLATESPYLISCTYVSLWVHKFARIIFPFTFTFCLSLALSVNISSSYFDHANSVVYRIKWGGESFPNPA